MPLNSGPYNSEAGLGSKPHASAGATWFPGLRTLSTESTGTPFVRPRAICSRSFRTTACDSEPPGITQIRASGVPGIGRRFACAPRYDRVGGWHAHSPQPVWHSAAADRSCRGLAAALQAVDGRARELRALKKASTLRSSLSAELLGVHSANQSTDASMGSCRVRHRSCCVYFWMCAAATISSPTAHPKVGEALRCCCRACAAPTAPLRVYGSKSGGGRRPLAGLGQAAAGVVGLYLISGNCRAILDSR